MRVIEYHPSNFEEVSKILNKARAEHSDSGEVARVIFNKSRQRFERYEPGEPTASRVDEYMHVEEAIRNHYIMAEVNEVADSMNAETVNEEEVARVGEDPGEDFTDSEEGITFDDGGPYNEPAFESIDDPELIASTQQNLKVLRGIKDKQNAESREKLSLIIAKVFGYDMVTESDIARAIVETNELKKLLSMTFSQLGVEVSSTQISNELKVSSGLLKFMPKIEYGIEDYRRGAAQCIANVQALAGAREQLDEKDNRIQELVRELGNERRILTETTSKLTNLEKEKTEARKINSIVPMEYVVSFDTPKGLRYITTTKDSLADDGTIPTKYTSSSSRIEKAYRFTQEIAQKQIERFSRHSKNVTFVDLTGKGPKEILNFFSVNGIAVLKITGE